VAGSTPAVGVVLVTHGQLAAELLNAAEMIVGDLPRFAAVSIGWHDDVTLAHEAIARAIAKVDAGAGVLILTDMFGGTPSNLGLACLEAGRVEVVTGVNLPMLIKLAKAHEEADLLTLARSLCEHGRAAIRVASDLLRSDREAETRARE
jgi:PTS system mannose-specific IIA component